MEWQGGGGGVGAALAEMVPGLARLGARTAGDPRILVALLDGPVDTAHPCFAGADLTSVDTLAAAPANATGAASRHGTHVASILFAHPDGALGGIAPRCRGLLLPIFTDLPGGGVAPCSQLDLARALLFAVDLGARVINVSGGQLEPDGQAHPILAGAVDRCAEAGALIVAAAGNDGCACLHVPASLPPVLAVGACDADGAPLPASNWGEAYGHRGLLAPGVGVPGAVPGGGIARRSGSSYAAAVVTGVAALLASLECQRGRRPDLDRIRRALLAGAAPCQPPPGVDPRRCLGGILDVHRAASLLDSGGNMHHQPAAAGAVPAATHHRPQDGPQAAPVGAVEAAGCGCGCAGRSADSSAQPCGCGGTGRDQCSCREGAGGDPGAGHGGQDRRPTLVYALGQLGHDFASEARRDWFVQIGVGNPDDPGELLAHLADHPHHAAAMTWTLLQDTTPIYALLPAGPFAESAYGALRELFADQVAATVERVSVPGVVVGRATLSNGQVVPLVRVDPRGLHGWSTRTLLAALAPGDGAASPAGAEVAVFLQRVYAELRNLGVLASERAVNFAATNAFQAERVFRDALGEGLRLDSIAVERSPLCRPESDCWDVRLTFFDPTRRLERAREVYRFTVDVSDVVPVTVGRPSHWPVY